MMDELNVLIAPSWTGWQRSLTALPRCLLACPSNWILLWQMLIRGKLELLAAAVPSPDVSEKKGAAAHIPVRSQSKTKKAECCPCGYGG